MLYKLIDSIDRVNNPTLNGVFEFAEMLYSEYTKFTTYSYLDGTIVTPSTTLDHTKHVRWGRSGLAGVYFENLAMIEGNSTKVNNTIVFSYNGNNTVIKATIKEDGVLTFGDSKIKVINNDLPVKLTIKLNDVVIVPEYTIPSVNTPMVAPANLDVVIGDEIVFEFKNTATLAEGGRFVDLKLEVGSIEPVELDINDDTATTTWSIPIMINPTANDTGLPSGTVVTFDSWVSSITAPVQFTGNTYLFTPIIGVSGTYEFNIKYTFPDTTTQLSTQTITVGRTEINPMFTSQSCNIFKNILNRITGTSDKDGVVAIFFFLLAMDKTVLGVGVVLNGVWEIFADLEKGKEYIAVQFSPDGVSIPVVDVIEPCNRVIHTTNKVSGTVNNTANGIVILAEGDVIKYAGIVKDNNWTVYDILEDLELNSYVISIAL